MKRRIILLACLAGTSSAAFGADLFGSPPPLIGVGHETLAVDPSPWEGGYVGINGGYAWGEAETGLELLGSIDFTDDEEVDADGWTLGGTVGMQIQAGPAVIGVEGDLSYTDIGQSATISDGFVDHTVGAELQYLGTARGRLGFAMDRVMVFATGGLAFGQIEAKDSYSFADASGTSVFETSDEDMAVGWTVGGGVEALVTDNLTAKLEYLYVDLGEAEFEYDDASAATIDYTAHLVRGGLNYKFMF